MGTKRLNLADMEKDIAQAEKEAAEASERALLNKAGIKDSNLTTISEDPLIDGIDMVQQSMRSNSAIEDNASDKAVKTPDFAGAVSNNDKMRAILDRSKSPLDKLLSKEEADKSKDKIDGISSGRSM